MFHIIDILMIFRIYRNIGISDIFIHYQYFQHIELLIILILIITILIIITLI